MNYIYDILLNFHEYYYEFFEWNKNDKIKNIMKIPTYRVSDQDLLALKNNKIKIDKKFLIRIKEDNKKYNKNICLVSNTKLAIGLLFDNNGNLIKKSSLIFEEEEEVNDLCKELPLTKIIFLKNESISSPNKSRIEKELKEVLINYINKTKEISTLKYLYYEYFNEECTNEKTIKKELINELEKEWNKKQKNLYHIVKVLNKNNQITK